MNAWSSGNWLFLNASVAILVISPFHSIFSNEQFLNALSPIDKFVPFNDNDVNDDWLANADVPIVSNVAGNLIDSNLPLVGLVAAVVSYWNAWIFIVSTFVLLKSASFIIVFLNESAPIVFKFIALLKSTLDNVNMLSKSPQPVQPPHPVWLPYNVSIPEPNTTVSSGLPLNVCPCWNDDEVWYPIVLTLSGITNSDNLLFRNAAARISSTPLPICKLIILLSLNAPSRIVLIVSGIITDVKDFDLKASIPIVFTSTPPILHGIITSFGPSSL